MRWRGRQESDNVEDRRGLPGGRMVLGGGIGGLVLIVVILLLGGDPTQLLDQGTQMMTPEGGPAVSSPEQEELKQLVAVVLKDTEDVWHTLLSERGREYVEPRLILFNGTSAQRMRWFRRGFESGDLSQGDTFNAAAL